jgi:glycosyltransferase involved in cell wall biosynthesis
MNVLYLTKNSDRAESAMITGVHKAGVQATVMGDLRSAHMQRIRDAGVHVIDVAWERRLDLKTLRLIRDTIANDSIDIIHAFTHRTVLHMVLSSKHLPVKLVAYRGVIGNISWLSPLSWVRFLNRRISRIVCVTEDIRRHLLGLKFLWFRLDPGKVVVIHKGHELSWYQETPADLGEFGIPQNAMVATCSSRLRRTKGLWELVEALSLTGQDRNIHVLFLGHEGDESLCSAIAETPHPERFHFAGFRKDAPAIMAASDVCVLPTHREGLSRAVIEAMAYRVTPLVTAVGGNLDLVVDGESGILFPVGDVEALAQGLERLYDQPELRRRLGDAARERISSHFRSSGTVDRTLDMYRQVMADQDGEPATV